MRPHRMQKLRLSSLLLAAALALTACSADDDHAPSLGAETDAAIEAGSPVDASPDSAAAEDAADDAGDATAQDAGGSIPATHGSVDLPFSLDVAGSGTTRVTQVSMNANVGGYDFNGKPHIGFAYQSHAWGAAGYDLYDVLSIPQDGSDLAVTYLYCQTGALPYIYSESFSAPMSYESASGTCDALSQNQPTQVDLPALTSRPDFLKTGILITADGLTLGSGSGQAVVAGHDYDLVPFNTVDCTTCPGGPWLELHSMFFADQQACFGIIYLFPNEPTHIQLDYVVCLPGLETPYAQYQGSWTGTLGAALRHTMPFRPEPRSWQK